MRRSIVGVCLFLIVGVFGCGPASVRAQPVSYADRVYRPPEARSVAELAHVYSDPSPEFVLEKYLSMSSMSSDVVTAHSASVFAKPDSGQVIGHVRRGEIVHLLRKSGPWTMIRTVDRRVGYVSSEAMSDVWVLVSKSKHMVYVYRGTDLLDKFPADFAINIVGDKVRRGSSTRPEDWRTPEGLFYITRRNPRSQFYRALVLNYPTQRHARQGLDLGLINRAEYVDIVQANMKFEHPPQHTILGGWIEFHGDGVEGKANWTHGCIALENKDIDKLWDLVDIGTPVLIQPYKPMLYDHIPHRVDPRPIVERTRVVPSAMLR